MLEGAKIIVNPQIAFNVIGSSVIEGCDKMWQGIEMENGARLTIAGSSEVNDAVNAIFADQVCTIDLNECTFRRNFKAIRIVPSGSPLLSFNNGLTISGANVIGTGPLLPPYTGQAPSDYGPRTFMGVELQRVSAIRLCEIGNNPLVVSDAEFGVWADGAFFTAENCIFTDLTNATPNTTQNGVGVFAKGFGYPTIQYCSFIRCRQGISLLQTNFLVQHNTMSQLWLGAYIRESELSFFPTVILPTIQFNIIENVNNGIYLLNNGDANVQVVDNTINKTAGFGIRVVDNPNMTSLSYIVDNDITLLGGFGYPVSPTFVNKTGIELVTTNNAGVCRNTVLFATNEGSNRGLSTEGGRTHTITNNTINMAGTLISNANQTAVRFSMTGSTKLHCNFPKNTARGLDVLGACAFTTFRTNEFDNHSAFGLRYNTTAAVGQQVHHGNTWAYANGVNNPGAVENGTDVTFNLYKVDCAENGDFCPTVQGNQTWFLDESTISSTIGCSPSSTTVCTELLPFTGGGGAESTTRIMAGDLNFGAYTASTNWLLDQQALHWIADNGLTQTTPYAAYVQAKSGTTAGKIVAMGAAHKAWLAQRATERAQMAQIWEDMIDIQNMSNPAQQDYDNFALKHSLLDSLRTAFRNSFDAFLAQLETDNNALNAQTVYEQNFKTVQQIWLDAYGRADGLLTAQERATLESIANQCADEGSVAVYWARGMLYSDVQMYSFDDEAICDAEERTVGIDQLGNTNSLVLQPNPTTGVFQLTLPDQGNYRVRIVNAIGSVVQEQTLPGGQQTIRLNEVLPNGTYWVQWTGTAHQSNGQLKVSLIR